MNQYVTGAMIRRLREEKGITQAELASRLHVSGKAVSKWETGQGFPDVSLLEPLARALDISVVELFSGENVMNRNRSSNMLRSVMYVCPVCGNGIMALGQAIVCCCGITLPPIQPEEPDEEHEIRVEDSDGEYYVTMDHPMRKDEYITFLGAVSDDTLQMVKTFPEGACEARFRKNRVRWIYAYCNRHGLFRLDMRRAKR
jgi:transcriptional regulator with XRE-family HTH domain